MAQNDREMGAAIQRLSDIERRLGKLEESAEGQRDLSARTEAAVTELRGQMGGLMQRIDKSDSRREVLLTEVRDIAGRISAAHMEVPPSPSLSPPPTPAGTPAIVAAGSAGITAGAGLCYAAIEVLKRVGLWHS